MLKTVPATRILPKNVRSRGSDGVLRRLSLAPGRQGARFGFRRFSASAIETCEIRESESRIEIHCSFHHHGATAFVTGNHTRKGNMDGGVEAIHLKSCLSTTKGPLAIHLYGPFGPS